MVSGCHVTLSQVQWQRYCWFVDFVFLSVKPCIENDRNDPKFSDI